MLIRINLFTERSFFWHDLFVLVEDIFLKPMFEDCRLEMRIIKKSTKFELMTKFE
ncbi:CLUMA_CG021037, isoform A [Clunio marinus]|uniref:CLUMA_CG021037, isoform A n=1 Tax=Clunio marinus TaxID=568069 RepID=A0A1J1J6Y0_9DIPT|nr:CLUMA_CG021037, isoform A [Clunio marinus]